MLVTKLIKHHMAAQRLHDTHTYMCQVRRQWYEQAKYDTGTWYADEKNRSALQAIQEDVR